MAFKKHKDIIIFCAIAFGSSWLLWLSLISVQLSGVVVPLWLVTAIVTLGMFGPMLSLFLTKRVILREASSGIKWGVNLKGIREVIYYALALFGPLLVAIFCAVFYFLLFPSQFDGTLSTLIATVPQDQIEMLGGESGVYFIIIIQLLVNGTLGAFINVLPSLGEEAGWRGFLYPQLISRFGKAKGLIFGGIIWGLWHLPLTVTGHNYGISYFGYPVLGALAMCVFCISSGICLAWLSHKTNSIWPAALGHGAINAFAGAPVLFWAAGFPEAMLFGPAITGLVAGVPLLVLAVVLAAGNWKAEISSQLSDL